MLSFVLHPLFEGSVVRLEARRKKAELSEIDSGSVDSSSISSVTPLSTLPAEEVAMLVASIQQAGESLEDSESSNVL
jgi:hypothetical protein